MQTDQWKYILQSGEEILWQGQPDSSLNYQAAAPSSIFFAIEVRRRNRSDYETEIGFERIYDAPQVYQMMREIQDQDTRTPSDTTSAVTLNAPDGTYP